MTPHLTTAETPCFLVYGKDPNLPIHQMLEPMQHFLTDPDSGCVDLELHHLTLAIAKKTLNENQLKYAQKTTNHTPPIFKAGNRIIFKKSNLANVT